ncbi:hypothetical protein HETIRDRAFT_453780 [Heterobasidion irregulare TC 32-1]|uniref:Uncharacterized protein n=1 Tax=Heterobasidion irregulare (strain TC 32-1) TaxID=747525 RepID=W4K0N3_HETIT|nr:uncharacterized protein HETIRDRAFT_453780 [Heterobasidion irregulare TC 32-1]ETW79347.1 hypothetical protein HETIRDRAFT_453780 [Heterobasidion irregulare TC 32-1]
MSQNQTRFEQELKSTVDEILQTCPKRADSYVRCRILNYTLEVVEHGRTAVVSDIEDETTSPQDPRLILHDSQGSSHGDAGTLELVLNFIYKRSRMTDIKDKLHAIRLCTAVPTYGGSLLEIADEMIIQLKARGS